MEEKTKIKCKHCGHTWETKSKTAMVTCAGCQLKTKNESARMVQE